MSFCSRLKEQRESIGMTRAELAEILGVTQAAIGNYENGVSTPKADILFKVFDALKCDANYLFQDEMNELEVDSFSVSEIKMIEKYRALDNYGKEMITLVLEKETERMKDDYVEIAARGGKQKVKVKKEKIIDWVERLNSEPYEKDEDLC